MDMSTAKTLTAEQFQALKSYAENEGEDWKMRLSIDWMRAGTDKWHAKETYHLLHQVRNRLGPKWLASFKFEDYEGQFND